MDDDWYRKHNVEPPGKTAHGITPDEIQEKLIPLKPHSWRLEGNKLIAKTDMGELINFIPTDYILTGTDENGLPTFRKIA